MFLDLKFALRQLAKAPGFTAAAVLVLALGLGANTAIFSVVEAALLRPLPFPHPEQLVRLYEAFDEPDTRGNTLNFSDRSLQQWREHGGEIFSSLGAATGGSVTLGANDGRPARSFAAARVTADFFPTLGLSPAFGRTFTAGEDRPGGPRVVIVGDDFWRRELGGRADIVGQTVMLDGVPHTIVGVMPKDFRHPYRADMWLPLAAAFNPAGTRGHYLYAVARLRPGISRALADAAIRRMCAAINAAAPDPGNPRRAYVQPLHDGFVVDLRPKLLAIAGAALCTLLIAAANFSGLLLARTVAREGETAVRAALGAGRGRLAREWLAQALLLAVAGAAAGWLIASWLTPTLVALSPEGSDATGSAMREFDSAVRLDWTAFAFAAGAVALVGIGFGWLPAWRAARVDLRSALNRGGRSGMLDRGTRRLLGGLVVAEIGAATVLLIATATLTQYFHQLSNEPWGFATEHRLSFRTMLSDQLFPDGASRARTLDRAAEELRALPGVRSATVTVPHPLNAAYELISNNADGAPPPEPRGYVLSYLRAGEPGYFATVGQRLVRGRDFAATDRANTPPVCIVSESYARRFWPGQNPIGRRVKIGRLDGPRPWLTVVGVAAETKAIADPNDGEVAGTLYFSLPQILAISSALYEFTFVLDATVEPRSLESAVRTALGRADARLAAYDLQSLAELESQTRVTERFALVLVSLFGALGLVLSAIGLYGLLALQLARRTREFGVRSALGATAAQLAWLVTEQGARLLAFGFVAGAGAGWMAQRLAETRWPDVPPLGTLPFAVAAFVLTAAVAIACWFPARRAARVDPMVALRAE